MSCVKMGRGRYLYAEKSCLLSLPHCLQTVSYAMKQDTGAGRPALLFQERLTHQLRGRSRQRLKPVNPRLTLLHSFSLRISTYIFCVHDTVSVLEHVSMCFPVSHEVFLSCFVSLRSGYAIVSAFHWKTIESFAFIVFLGRDKNESEPSW